MGHYDSAYEHEASEARDREKTRAKCQLRMMEKFHEQLLKGPGEAGISKRHLHAFEDMLNETKLRAL